MAENESGGAVDWRAALPETVRADPALKDFKDAGALAESYLATKKLVGSSIRPPGPEASPEARKEFLDRLQKAAPELVLVPEDEKARGEVEDAIYTKLGRPKEAKEYAAPKDVELPEAALEALRAEAAAEGLTKRQFEARATRAAAALGLRSKAVQEMKGALKRELGAAYDERIAQAVAAAEKVGFPGELVQALRAGEVDLQTFKAISAVAKGFGQPLEVGLQGGGAPGRITPAEAKARMADLRANKRYWDGDPTLKAKMAEYAAQAFPEG